MKRIVCAALSFLLIFAFFAPCVFADAVRRAQVSNYAFTADSEGVFRLEAEDVDVTHYVISSDNPSKIVERADASGGKFLAAATGAVKDGQYFEFAIELKFNAEIVMSAAYAQTNKWKSRDEDMTTSYTYLIDENKTVGLQNGYILKARDDITKWDVVTYDKFTLPEGTHSFKVRVAQDTGKGNPNIDYIDFYVTKIENYVPDDPAVSAVPDNDIHTEAQYKYINDADPKNVHKYASGVSEQSRPKAIVCDFSDDIADAAGYVIQKASKSDFSDAVTVTGLKEKSYGFYNVRLGERFYWRAGTSADTIGESPVHFAVVASQGPRNCYVDGVTNVRDIGGYASSLVLGGKIRQGLYYRGAALNSITNEGKRQLTQELGVKAEIDLRDSYQCTGPYVDGVAYYPVPIPSGTENTRFEEFADEYKQIFSVIADADNNPVLLHCTAGADRTGISTFILLTVCGVSYEDALRDYLFTNFSTHGARYPTVFEQWYAKLDNFDGATKAEQAKNWMLSKGISEDTVEHIREIFVDGYTAYMNAPHVSVAAAQINKESREMRLIAAVDSLEYISAGFEIAVADKERNVTVTKTYAGENVFSSIISGGRTLTSVDFGIVNGYLCMLIIEGIPDGFYIDVRPLAACFDGTVYRGAENTFEIANDDFKAG